jgi:hypothetical protein
MLEDEDPGEHELALGNTRPALMPYLNMPWVDFVIFLMAAVEAVVSRWQFLIPIGALFAGSLVLYRRDYNAGRCFVTWFLTSGRHLGATDLGGTFISPSLVSPPGTFRGLVADE